MREGLYLVDFLKPEDGRTLSVSLVLDIANAAFTAVLGRMPKEAECRGDLFGKALAGAELTSVQVEFLHGSLDRPWREGACPHAPTREQAIQYFLQNALLSERDATKEVERYFNNPGQATSYMIGQLRILELRDRARQALGDRFDIRQFHSVVLENGAVPLDVLEDLVDAWIEERRNG